MLSVMGVKIWKGREGSRVSGAKKVQIASERVKGGGSEMELKQNAYLEIIEEAAREKYSPSGHEDLGLCCAFL